MFKKILVATEGSEPSLNAVKKAYEFLEGGFVKEVTFLYVVNKPGEERIDGLAVFRREMFSKDADQIADIAAKIKNIFGPKEFKMQSEFGNVPDTICKVAEEGDYELIMLGHRGLNALERYFLGSVSSKVANNAPCSVMIVR